jgi:hypothetical protein
MANEITTQVFLKCVKGDFSFVRQPSARQSDQSGTHFDSRVVSVGTSEEEITVNADVATLGWAFLRNLDDVGTIAVGTVPSTGVYAPFLLLYPGDCSLVHLYPGITLYAKSTITAGADLEVAILED